MPANPSPSVATAESALDRLRASPLGEIVWLLTLGGCLALHAAGLVAAFARPDLVDFAAFVDNARAWLDGTPYPDTSRDPNTPHVILLFTPFVHLPYGAGLIVWMAISYACIALTLRAIIRELSLTPSRPLALTAVALLAAAPPMLDVVINGNMIWPLTAAFTWAWIWDRRGHDHRSAALLGVLMTAKPFLGVFLLRLAVRRRWAAAGTTLAAAGVTLTVAIAVTGVDAWSAWLSALERISWYDVRFNASAMGVIARISEPEILPWLMACAMVAAATGWWVYRARVDLDRDWTLVLFASLLMAPLGWRYYLCFGLGPLLALWSRDWFGRAGALVMAALAWSPSLEFTDAGAVVQATAGSIPFWILLAAWIVLGRGRGGVAG